MNKASQDYLDLSGINDPVSSKGLLSEKNFPVLKGMSPLSLRILNDAAHITHVPKGVEMLHEGDTPHDLSFIKSGKVSIAKHSDAKLKIVAQLKPGEVYGEFGILRKKLHFASVYTAEASEIVRIEHSAVQQVLDADINFKTQLNDLLSRRMLDSFFFSHPAFQTLSSSDRTQISRGMPIQYHPRNTLLFTQGKKPEGIYLILSGEVEIFYTKQNRDQILLEIRRDNDILGELAVNNGSALAYSATASSNLDILLLDAAAMKNIRENYPETFSKLEQYINKRAKRTSLHLKESCQ